MTPLLRASHAADLQLPDTGLVDQALERARDTSPPWLFNHVMRSWLFASVLAGVRRMKHDPEVLAVASILHDLGLVEPRDDVRFEVAGADAAWKLASNLEAVRRQRVWDAIALHGTSSIARFKEPEVALTNAGVVADYAGVALSEIGEERTSAIVKAFPREAMKEAFTERLCEHVRLRPPTTWATWVADFGHRFVENYSPPSAVDALWDAPFAE
jgi:HD superfamily phosphodiesterase